MDNDKNKDKGISDFFKEERNNNKSIYVKLTDIVPLTKSNKKSWEIIKNLLKEMK